MRLKLTQSPTKVGVEVGTELGNKGLVTNPGINGHLHSGRVKEIRKISINL